jgi:putative transposase
MVSYESVREWCLKFGAAYAKRIRAHGPRPGDRWHLDEVFLEIQGKLRYLWRAVDQDGEVLDTLVQSRRNKRAAKNSFRKLLKVLQYVPRVIVTDKLRSYAAAKAEIPPLVQHELHTGLNTEQRTRTNQRENESGVCEASSRLDRRSVFSRPLG